MNIMNNLVIQRKHYKIIQGLQNTMPKRIFCTTSKDSTQDQYPNVPALVENQKLDTERIKKYEAIIMNLHKELEYLREDLEHVGKMAHDRYLTIAKLSDQNKSLHEELEAQHSTMMSLSNASKQKDLYIKKLENYIVKLENF